MWSHILSRRLAAVLFALHTLTPLAHSEGAAVPVSISPQGEPEGEVFQVNTAPPEGFAELMGVQRTQADIYFGGLFVVSTFVEFDLETIEILDPLTVVEAIPNVAEPASLAQALGGLRPSNSGRLCNSRRVEGCGSLSAQNVDRIDLIFDDSRFRVDLFIHPNELLTAGAHRERYLPAAGSDRALLHNIRSSFSGRGADRRYNLSSESFYSQGASRLRARYGVSDDGPTLYEMSWQRDGRDTEYEVGSFRALGRNITFAAEHEVLGLRVATSTKRRTDLDQTLGTPLLLFLSEQSRVDIYRGDELIESRYYDPGNQEIDTTGFPEGAYEVRMRIVGMSGAERDLTQFYIKSAFMPPWDEPQYYMELGRVLETEPSGLPRLGNSDWMRLGSSHRIHENISWDNEVTYADGRGLIQSGAFILGNRWQTNAQLYAGAMVSDAGDLGISLRGSFIKDEITAILDYRQVDHDGWSGSEFELIPRSFTQASLMLGMPLGEGRFVVRGRLNKRVNKTEHDVGFSYWGLLFNKMGLTANFSFDATYGTDDYWVQAGIQIRWQGRAGRRAFVRPGLRYASGDLADADAQAGYGASALLDARWQHRSDLPYVSDYVGPVQQAYYLHHDAERSSVGARFVPLDLPDSDFELGLAKQDRDTDLYYAANNRFSVVTKAGKTIVGDGGYSAGALVVSIDGSANGLFEVIVDDRAVGKVWAGSSNVFSLRPYATYSVKVRPDGGGIYGFDESTRRVTVYPGNVETLTFSAHNLMVLVGQVVTPEGAPLALARFENVEGFGLSDDSGWFQVEVAGLDPLLVSPQTGPQCQIELPEIYAEDGLGIVDEVVCVPVTQAKP